MLTLLPVVFFSLLPLANAAFPDCIKGPLASNLVCDSTASVSARAKAVVAEFTVSELIANTGYQSPGVSRLGLPAYNWWSEALHGVAFSPGVTFQKAGSDFSYATSFPAPINLGAAFDDALVGDVASIISTEARAFNNFGFAGLDYFTPNINPFKDPRWGRGQETPGEDPYHISRYVVQLIGGLQGGFGSQKYIKVAADCKHWAAYDLENWNGNNRKKFDAIVSQQDLSEYYSPSFQACVRDANVSSIMCSYNSVNGVPSCASSFLLQSVLREHWDFESDSRWIVGDCEAVHNIFDPHGYASDDVHAAADALNAGVDIDCGTTYPKSLGAALNASLVTEGQLRKALTRQYASLIRLGYFDPPSQQPFRQLNFDDVSTRQAQDLAYTAAVESIVLLKNDGVLPLAPSTVPHIALIGPWANATTKMQSNYQGAAPFLISPLQGLTEAGFNVTSVAGTTISGNSTSGFAAALAAANKSDVIIYAGGIDTSIEGESHDRTTITWPGNQRDLIQQLSEVGKPFVVLQMGGGQIDSSFIKSNSDVNALIWGGYPGQSGGAALADILTGKVPPAGRLPITQYPAEYVDQVPMTDMNLRPSSSSPGRTYKWYTGSAVYEFGFGLHLTTFDLAWTGDNADQTSYNIQELVKAGRASGAAHLDLAIFDTFEVNVKNTGSVASDYVALLFSNTTAGPSPAPLKELVSYTRVKSVSPGSSSKASLEVTLGSISRVDKDGNRNLHPGTYNLWIDTDRQISRQIELTGDAEQIDTWPGA
jgi:beta-D-xylosidase 4